MYTTQTIGAGIGIFAFAVSFPAFSSLFNQPYMLVHEMSVFEGRVFVDREFTRDFATVADWQVVVVPDSGNVPSCSTVHGPREHQGWSVYEPKPRKRVSFEINEWVNDPNCESNLVDGETYKMFVTWTPRDDTRPVTARAEFSWPQEAEE